MFNIKENSMKTLWNNLNTTCSFKKKNHKFNITKINVHNEDITDDVQRINKYFCNIGDSLVNKLPQKGYSKADFLDYCKPSLLSIIVWCAIL